MKHTKFNDYSDTYVFDTKKAGKTIGIFGGIHGNETAGIEAIEKLVKEIESGELELLSGKLILALGNREAIKSGEREVKHNLNRLFKKQYLNEKTEENEIKRAKELADIIEELDVLFDIHSVSSQSVPFMFAEDIGNEIEIASNIFGGNIIIGWGDFSGGVISGDTDSYAHSLGKIAFTIECGNHNDSGAGEIAYSSSVHLLSYFGLVNDSDDYKAEKGKLIQMYKIQTTKTGKFKFVEAIDNFSYIKEGDLIGYDGDEKIYAKENFIILLPKYKLLKPGEEVFFYGRDI